MDQPNPIKVNRHTVHKNSWYRYNLTTNPGINYKCGTIKICGANEKEQLIPAIKLPNIIFSDNDKIVSLDDLDKLTSSTIYFKTKDNITALIYFFNVNISYCKLTKVDENEVRKAVSLWKLRRYYDLEYIKYYIDNIFVDFNSDFVDRFSAEYKLFKKANYLDNYIIRAKIDVTDKQKDADTFNVLYLTSSSIQYETTGYTLRTHELLKSANTNKKNYRVVFKNKEYCNEWNIPENRRKSD